MIAYLIIALVEAGQRVLVTSHTHAAVDQALYEAVKPEVDPGPLAGHQAVADGKILRIGRTADQKVPKSVRLDEIMESRAREVEIAIAELKTKAEPLTKQRAWGRMAISEWDKLTELTELSPSVAQNSRKKRCETGPKRGGDPQMQREAAAATCGT